MDQQQLVGEVANAVRGDADLRALFLAGSLGRVIEEFIRVLGLLPVAVGRCEHVVATRGAGLLRDKLIDLMLEDAALPGGHGALHLSRLLPPEDMACLAALPPARPDRPDVEAHLATARAFVPRARRMARDLGLPWPEAFTVATARHLEAELGVRLDLGRGRPRTRTG